jgi:DivIVA domain-containing protein
MEEKKISLNAEKVLRKTFTPNVKGYDPNEVDSFLDEVINDYRGFEGYSKDAKAYIMNLEEQQRKLKDANAQLTLENAKMKSRLAGVKDGTDVNSTNLGYINRIAKLENALWGVGIDPRNVK